MILISNNGSEWHKWDLHIHTPYSWLNNNYEGTTDEQFVQKISDSKLSAVGITNYFRFHENEISSEGSLRKKLEGKGIVVFPNLEFRLANQNAKDDLCDYHIIFSPDLPDNKIDLFLQNLTVIIGQNTKKAIDLSKEELSNNTLYVERNDIYKAIDEVKIRDKVMFGFLSRGKGESRSSSVADLTLKESDFIIHSSDEKKNIDQDYAFWTRPSDDKECIMPIFQGSDAHSLAEIGNKYTWIKSKLTFDGLLQTKYNPAERIRFRDNNPAEDKLPQTIIKKLISADQEIVFNDDLNSFIGKRGGGKSILLKAIAQRVCSEEYNSRFEGAEKIAKDSEWIKTIFGDDYKVVWADGYISSKEESERNILYLPQGYLSNLAYDEYEKVKERNEFITSLLMHFDAFRIAKESNGNYNTEIRGLIEEKIGKIVELSNNNKTLRKINLGIGERKGLENGVTVLKNKIKELSKKNNITDSENELFQNASIATKNITALLKTIGQDLEILDKVKDTDNILTLRSEIFHGLSDDIRKDITSKILSDNEKNIPIIITDKRKELLKTQKDKMEELKKAQKIVDDLGPKFKAKTELHELTTKKINLEKSLETLKDNEQQIEENTKDGKKTIEDVIRLFFSYKDMAKKIYGSVHLDFLEFSKIDFMVNFSKESFSRTVEQNINRNKSANLSEDSKTLLRDELGEPSEEQLRNIIHDVLKNGFVFKASVNDDKKQFLSSLLNNPYEVDYLDSIRTNDNAHTPFDQMTGGQKAITMLELIFKLDTNNYPILIDQPEDDLDASGITANVVNFITKQKDNRQIFIASHNANLVVCSDSEEVIIADRGEDFIYSSGAIEDKDIRKSIIDIMEGGKDALRLRMRKLKVSSINNE